MAYIALTRNISEPVTSPYGHGCPLMAYPPYLPRFWWTRERIERIYEALTSGEVRNAERLVSTHQDVQVGINLG